MQLPAKEYATFEGRELTWGIDVQFMLSSYQCLFGMGCQGIDEQPHHGCCSIGAYFIDERDIEATRRMVEASPDSAFQRPALVRNERWLVKGPNKQYKTWAPGGRCVFSNDPDHPNGAGCALHQQAMAMGEDPVGRKPRICSWVPLNYKGYDDDEDGVVYLVPFENHQWGHDDHGNEHNKWYCIDDEKAYSNGGPVYRRMQSVLLDMLDGDEEVLAQINEYLDARYEAMPTGVRVEIGKRHGDGRPDWVVERDNAMEAE